MASAKTDGGRAAGCGRACTAHHPEGDSVLAFAKEWDKLAHVELCAALATLLPGPRLVWYLPYVCLCTLILTCGAFACCEIRLSSLLC